jgi:uncharacterized protein YbaR (Trm112 family)
MGLDTELPLGVELLGLLRCPASGQKLLVAPRELLFKLEAQRAAGTLCDRSGKPLAEKILAGLVREDGTVFYPIRNQLPILLAEESLACAG